ncbi:hypothetical protein Tco_0616258 [Tanacetum coccineum]
MASMAMIRAATPSTYIIAPRSKTPPLETPPSGTPPLLPIPLPTPSPPLLLPSTDCRASASEVTLSPRKRLCIALGPRYKVGESSSAPTNRPTGGFRVDYGFVATLDDEIRRDPERYVGYGITDTWDDMVEDMTQMRYMGDWMMHRMIGESTRDYSASLADRDFSLESSTPRSTGTACGDTKTDEYTADTCDNTAGTAGTH